MNNFIDYMKLVLVVSFVVSCIAAIITSSMRIAAGTIVLGIFLGYMVFIGMYNQ